MAELKINGRTTVRKLKEDFKKAFGSSLRVYQNVSCKGRYADDAATLASIRTANAKGGELVVGGAKRVGKFEEECAANWGIGVQVANADDTALAKEDVTLVQAGK